MSTAILNPEQYKIIIEFYIILYHFDIFYQTGPKFNTNIFMSYIILIFSTRLDPDEEAALSTATLDDIMALADILNTNPQARTNNNS